MQFKVIIEAPIIFAFSVLELGRESQTLALQNRIFAYFGHDENADTQSRRLAHPMHIGCEAIGLLPVEIRNFSSSFGIPCHESRSGP